MGGKIQCSNTLMDWFMLAYKDMHPEIRNDLGGN
jgi:hypothetical protein